MCSKYSKLSYHGLSEDSSSMGFSQPFDPDKVRVRDQPVLRSVHKKCFDRKYLLRTSRLSALTLTPDSCEDY